MLNFKQKAGMEEAQLLNTPINELGFSRNFSEGCSAMGFATLNEILQVQPIDLTSRQGFSYHWLAELVDFLALHGQMALLQGLPGSPA